MPTVDEIARVCHEANRAYCQTLGDFSQFAWESAPDWQKSSAVNGVKFHIDNPSAGPSGSHENWLKVKTEEGWVYGETKDLDKKTHPCCVPYDQLPEQQRLKDHIFVGIVRAMTTNA